VDVKLSDEESKDGIIIITRKKLIVDQMVGYIKLDDRVFYSGD
jgi:hypothetical protein